MKPLSVISLALVLALSGCSSADRNSEDDINQKGEEKAFETEVEALEIKLGDCFFALPDDGNFSTLKTIPCREGHGWQIFHQGYINNLSEYSLAGVDEETIKICDEAWDDLPRTLNDSALEEYGEATLIEIYPTAESWKEGDREVNCVIGSDTTLYYNSILDEKYQD